MRQILQAPHDSLRSVCAPVTAFDADLKLLTDEMFVAMYDARGRGLAAPQVGIPLRVFVMDVTWKDEDASPRVFVNPKVSQQSDKMAAIDETCLSIPLQSVAVSRPAAVTLNWQDLDGAPHEASFDGTAAAIVQHECDHLDGVLITDYATQP